MQHKTRERQLNNIVLLGHYPQVTVAQLNNCGNYIAKKQPTDGGGKEGEDRKW